MEIHIPELDQIKEMLASMRKEIEFIKGLIQDTKNSGRMIMKEAVEYTRVSASTIKLDIKVGRLHPQHRERLYLRAEVTRGGKYRFVRKDLDEFYGMFATLPKKSARRIPY